MSQRNSLSGDRDLRIAAITNRGDVAPQLDVKTVSDTRYRWRRSTQTVQIGNVRIRSAFGGTATQTRRLACLSD